MADHISLLASGTTSEPTLGSPQGARRAAQRPGLARFQSAARTHGADPSDVDPSSPSEPLLLSARPEASTALSHIGLTREIITPRPDPDAPAVEAPTPVAAGVASDAERQMLLRFLAPRQDALVAERNALIDKQFSEGLSSPEEHRLEVVCWHLDRIDDALVGPELDRLERLVESHERLAATVRSFADRMSAARRVPRPTPRGPRR